MWTLSFITASPIHPTDNSEEPDSRSSAYSLFAAFIRSIARHDVAGIPGTLQRERETGNESIGPRLGVRAAAGRRRFARRLRQ
jgi:hypothetical protein